MKNYGLFIGIDISKKWIDVSLTITGDKSNMVHRRFDNHQPGFKKLLSWIGKFAKENKIEKDWLICMEHTGVYSLPLCVFLKTKHLDYALESALQINRSLGIRRGKSDKADSKDIAKYAFQYHKSLKVNNLPSQQLMQIKNLLTFRKRLVKQRTAHKSSSTEFNKLMPEQFQLSLIKESTKEFISALNKQIRQVDKAIKEIINSNEELEKLYNLVTSVKGIGLVIGANMLVCTNAFKGFKNARQFACYIAVAPFGKSSGSSLNVAPKVGKLGSSKLKALFSNACMAAIQHDPQIKAYFNRKIEEGKTEGCVYNAIKNKLIARIFAVVKRGTPYVELTY